MADYALGWSDVALDAYLALSPETRQVVDARIALLLDTPDGPGSSYDPTVDRWTTTAAGGTVLLVYVFRVGRPRLVILRLVQM